VIYQRDPEIVDRKCVDAGKRCTARFEFLARPARTWIVAPRLGHGPRSQSVARQRRAVPDRARDHSAQRTRTAFIDKVHVTEQALRVRAHPQDQLLEVLVYEDVRHHLAQDLLEVSSVVVR
jgi:hypothetical protein